MYPYNDSYINKDKLENLELLRPWVSSLETPGWPWNYIEHTHHSIPQGPIIAWTY